MHFAPSGLEEELCDARSVLSFSFPLLFLTGVHAHTCIHWTVNCPVFGEAQNLTSTAGEKWYTVHWAFQAQNPAVSACPCSTLSANSVALPQRPFSDCIMTPNEHWHGLFSFALLNKLTVVKIQVSWKNHAWILRRPWCGSSCSCAYLAPSSHCTNGGADMDVDLSSHLVMLSTATVTPVVSPLSKEKGLHSPSNFTLSFLSLYAGVAGHSPWLSEKSSCFYNAVAALYVAEW